MEDYTVLRKLGQGGQGATMLVKHVAGSETMVLKQCKCENLKEANSALKEAKVLQRLTHLSIVRYHDVFLAEKGQYLIICTLMEYCSGGDLAVYMNKLRHENQRIPERTVLTWTVDMMTGLEYLHNANIVHRDMKPLNVFMTSGGNVKLGDFGLASTSKRDKQTSKVGTPCYLSPEILQNETYGPAVDVWGAGCIMLEMMTFEFLWERKGMLSVQVLGRPVTPADLPGNHSRALKKVVVLMLDKEPENRPTPAAVASRCREIQNGDTAEGQARGCGGGVNAGDMGIGIGHLAQGIEAIWKRAGSGLAEATQSGADVGEVVGDNRGNWFAAERGGDGRVGGHGRYEGKVAEYRRKTPAQAARGPSAGQGQGNLAAASPPHAGMRGPQGAAQRKSRSLAIDRLCVFAGMHVRAGRTAAGVHSA